MIRWIGFFFFFLVACQSGKNPAFTAFVKEQLQNLQETKCGGNTDCVEERGRSHISGKLCRKTYQGHGFSSHKDCVITAYKVLSEFVGRENRPTLMECQPGEYCMLPFYCSYEEAQIASTTPGRGCGSSDDNY